MQQKRLVCRAGSSFLASEPFAGTREPGEPALLLTTIFPPLFGEKRLTLASSLLQTPLFQCVTHGPTVKPLKRPQSTRTPQPCLAAVTRPLPERPSRVPGTFLALQRAVWPRAPRCGSHHPARRRALRHSQGKVSTAPAATLEAGAHSQSWRQMCGDGVFSGACLHPGLHPDLHGEGSTSALLLAPDFSLQIICTNRGWGETRPFPICSQSLLFCWEKLVEGKLKKKKQSTLWSSSGLPERRESLNSSKTLLTCPKQNIWHPWKNHPAKGCSCFIPHCSEQNRAQQKR